MNGVSEWRKERASSRSAVDDRWLSFIEIRRDSFRWDVLLIS